MTNTPDSQKYFSQTVAGQDQAAMMKGIAQADRTQKAILDVIKDGLEKNNRG